MKKWVFILLAGIFLTSIGCSDVIRRKKRSEKTTMQPFVFRMNYFLADGERDVSFPVWFNDTLIQQNRIKTLIHRTMLETDTKNNEMRAIRIFRFDEQGRLLVVQRKKFYENVLVENVTFKYNGVIDEKGFASVEIIDSMNPNEVSKYNNYDKELYHKEYIVYNHAVSGDYFFCVLDENLYEIVSVDSLFNPTPRDVIQYGGPKKPIRRFQVENLVNEKNVTVYRYFNGSDLLRRVEFDNYPFYVKKEVSVSKSGLCSGYVDSTFSEGKYLNRTVSKFSFNKDQLPVKLVHRGMKSGQFELFEYEYYD